MSPDDEAIGMVVPDGFCLQESRQAALDSSLVKRGVLVGLSMGWFGGLTTRQSQERTKHLYDYRVHLAEDQRVRSMKLPLDAYSTDPNARVGAWVLLEPNGEEQTGDAVGESRQECQLVVTGVGGERPAVSCRGRTLTPNVRNVDGIG